MLGGGADRGPIGDSWLMVSSKHTVLPIIQVIDNQPLLEVITSTHSVYTSHLMGYVSSGVASLVRVREMMCAKLIIS